MFDGRELTETTTYEYDEGGLLTRSVTVREAAWTEQDRGWVLAHDLYRAQMCPLHGGPLTECSTEAAEGTFEVPPPIRCRAHELKLLHIENHKTNSKAETLLWTVRKKRRG